MRDSLFRAAQRGNYFPMEEVVAQHQDLGLTQDMFTTSAYPVNFREATPSEGPRMVIWPYPAGTGDCIDRANCADDFLRAQPDFRVVTKVGLPSQDSLASTKDDLLIFAPFETIIPELRVDEGGYLAFRGRRAHAMMNELSLGYLSRAGIINLVTGTGGEVTSPKLSTHFVNGTMTGLSKAAQMKHFTALSEELATLGVRPLPHSAVNDDEQFSAVADNLLSQGKTVVARPFSASQGTAVTFLNAARSSGEREAEIASKLAAIKLQMERKYGSAACYPLTLSPFERATTIDGCVTDLRIFVTYNPKTESLHGLPGMVRRAQVPINARASLEPASAATNLNIPAAPDAIPGNRVFALANEEILGRLGISPGRLLQLGKAATLLWAKALQAEQTASGPDNTVQFSYGSADFVIAASDGLGVPIEMNGNNVGSHPAVHPRFLNQFGASTTHALQNLGIGR